MNRHLSFFLVIAFNYLLAGTDSVRVQYDTVWVFDHYEADSNYIVGIWPQFNRVSNRKEVSRLKDVFGFNYIALEIPIDKKILDVVTSSGFPREKVMITFYPHTLEQRVREFGKVFAYYLDEPNERGHPVEDVRELIEKYARGSEFIISGYRRTTRLTELVPLSDGVMFSSYKHWWQCLPNVWCAWPYNDDQREDWTDMKERYGEKSFMNWVGAHRDTLEYMDLLKHAADLKLKGVWLYQYENPSDKNIFDFCYAAWKNGFMKRSERKYIYEYKCISSDCSSFNKNDLSTWILTNIRITGEIRVIRKR